MSLTLRELWRRFLLRDTKPRLAKRGSHKNHKPLVALQIEELEARLVPTTSIVNSPPNISATDYRFGMTAANTSESILTPANVNVNSFGKRWDNEQILGQVYAQPLYLPNLALTINGQTETQNTLLVATEANMLYWVSADSGKILNSVDFDNYRIAGATAVTPVPSQDVGEGSLTGTATTNTQIYPQIGITSTPLYDNGQLYVVAYKKETISGQTLAITCSISKWLMSPPARSIKSRSPTPASTAPITRSSPATRSCRAPATAPSMVPSISTPSSKAIGPK